MSFLGHNRRRCRRFGVLAQPRSLLGGKIKFEHEDIPARSCLRRAGDISPELGGGGTFFFLDDGGTATVLLTRVAPAPLCRDPPTPRVGVAGCYSIKTQWE